MPTFVAMLRGVNVSGHNPVKMDRLRASFEAAGFRNARTYLQSGNVVFTPGSVAASRLAKAIGVRLQQDFGFQVATLLRSSEEMKRVVGENPFLRQNGIDLTRLHVTFLFERPKASADHLKALAAGPERFHLSGREVFLYCPNGYGTTKLSNVAIERKLGVTATTRNWKTVNALTELARS